MATITSTQTGNWTTGATWVGGVAPAVTDNAVIASGHDVTKDDAISAPDIVDLDIQGKLIIASTNGLQMTGALTATNGELQLDDTAEFDFARTSNSSQASLTLTFNGTSPTSPVVLKQSSSGELTFTGNLAHTFVNASFIKTGAADSALYIYNVWRDILFDGCTFSGPSNGCEFAGTGFFVLKDCYIHGCSDGIHINGEGAHVELKKCKLGTNRSEGADANAEDIVFNRSGCRVYSYNSLFNAATLVRSNSYSNDTNCEMISYAHQGEASGWFKWRDGSEIEWVDDDTGELSMLGIATYTTKRGNWHDFPIPIEDGDTISSFSIQVRLPVGWNGSSGDLVFTVDDPEFWGLNETKEPVYVTEHATNYQTITFDGGTAAKASGSATKGTLLLRVDHKKNDATPIFIKPPVYTIS